MIFLKLYYIQRRQWIFYTDIYTYLTPRKSSNTHIREFMHIVQCGRLLHCNVWYEWNWAISIKIFSCNMMHFSNKLAFSFFVIRWEDKLFSVNYLILAVCNLSKNKTLTYFAFFLVHASQRTLQEMTQEEWRQLGKGLFDRQTGLVLRSLLRSIAFYVLCRHEVHGYKHATLVHQNA